MTFSVNPSFYSNMFFYHKTLQLKQAVNSGDQRLVQTLLTVDQLDVNYTPNGRDTYLHLAIARNDLPMVQLLVEFKANVNPCLLAHDALSPLWMAMLHSYDDISKFLVQAGADVTERLKLQLSSIMCRDYTINGDMTSLLHLAVARNHEAHVNLFLDYGADVNCVDTVSNESALRCAVFREFISLATLLIDRGAYLESTNVDGMTSLHTALIIGNVDLIKMLIERGANVMAVDDFGKTALHFVAESNVENIDIAEQLLRLGVSVNQTELTGNLGPLHVAILTRKRKLAKLFVQHGADVRARISSGYAPLSLANLYCGVETMRLLIAKGADVNVKTDDGVATLHEAAGRDSADKVKVLLQYGANINSLDNRGRTPLAWLENMEGEVAKVLVKQIAIMHEKGAFIEEGSMQVIRSYTPLLAHFNQCLAELEFIKNTPFHLSYTLRNMLDEKQRKLAALMRNRNFILGFHSIKINVHVPNFEGEILIKFTDALFMRNALYVMERFLNVAFYDSLPELIVKNIVKHMKPQDIPNLIQCVQNTMLRRKEGKIGGVMQRGSRPISREKRVCYASL